MTDVAELPRDKVIGLKLVEIGHSDWTEPELVYEGLGDSTYRAHYLRLSSGLVLNLFSAEITAVEVNEFSQPGDTGPLKVPSLLYRHVTALCRDESESSHVLLDNEILLLDDYSFTSNYLVAYSVRDDYHLKSEGQFFDYWTGEPMGRLITES